MKAPKMIDMSVRVCSPDVEGTWQVQEGKDDRDRLHDVPDKFGRLLPCRTFLQAMMNRMTVSYNKYGSFLAIFPKKATGLDNAKQRIALYEQDGNVEWLVDAANYLMMEGACPSHPDAHFRATGSDESPGRVDNDGQVRHGRNEELLADAD